MKRRFLMSTAIFALLVFVLATSIFADTTSATSLRTLGASPAAQNMQSKHKHRRWHRRWHRRHHHGHKKG